MPRLFSLSCECFFFFKQKTAYEMRISDWSSDVCSSDLVGMKSRGCYETPAGTIMLRAHRAIESLTLDREAAHLKDDLMPRYASLVYNGYWWSPERQQIGRASCRERVCQ